MKKIRYGIYLFVVVVIAMEVFLRFYDPLPSVLMGDKIMLPVNTSLTISNEKKVNGLDSHIVVKKNSLGFRGPELPKNAGTRAGLKIIAIGGSTTECVYITEGKTWEDVVSSRLQKVYNNTWINNAGLDGHSTYGHLLLLQQYVLKLKPDICIFLLGANDVGRTDLNKYDSSMLRYTGKSVSKKHWLAQHSRLFALCLNLYRGIQARTFHLDHNYKFTLLNESPLVLPDSVIATILRNDTETVKNYRLRLLEIVRLCRANKIEPVFITQPYLLGEGKDDVSGVDLETFPFDKVKNGKAKWMEMELYNLETKTVAKENNVFVIDLAHQLPKSSRYFYDTWHFNNAGCEQVGTIVSQQLLPFLQNNYSPRHSP
jgi:lysophospholipase L1-like esterase